MNSTGSLTGVSAIFAAPDGYLYVGNGSTIQKTPLSNPGTWTDLSTGVASGFAVQNFGMLSNGTLIATMNNSSTSVKGNIYYWNGSTWVFSVATGSTLNIYAFTQDSAGVTWFATAFNGDMWSNGSAGSTTFTKVYSNVYSYWNNGSSGGYGAVYAFKIYDLGSGPQFIYGGEGDINISTPNFASNSSCLTATQGYGGNVTNIEKSANYLILTRGYSSTGSEIVRYGLNASLPGYHQFNLVTTASGGYPAYSSGTHYGSLKFVNGATWEWQTTDVNTNVNTLYQSNDDGATWHNDSTGLSAGCISTMGPRIASGSGTVVATCAPSGTLEFWYSVP